MFSVHDFEIAQIPAEADLQGLTPQILWDLYDIGSKFGVVRIHESIVSFQFRLTDSEELTIFLPIKKEPTTTFVVGKFRDLEKEENTITVPLINNSFVYWAKGLSVDEVKRAIPAIDAAAFLKGLIDEKGSRRPATYLKGTEPKYKVRDFFAKKHSMMLASPNRLSAKASDAIKEFDQPDLLIIMKDPVTGLEGIILKEDEDFFRRKNERDLRLLREQGIDFDKLQSMSTQERIAVRSVLDSVSYYRE